MATLPKRTLAVVADDLGIGPNTTQGILEAGRQGLLTGAVLIVNTPYSEQAVADWRRLGKPFELGWHPNLTLDRPIAGDVPSLVQPDGRFWSLGSFVTRALLGRFKARDLETELRCQYLRYVELVGEPPRFVNAHQHVALFQPVGRILISVLRHQKPAPYVRMVQEPWSLIYRIPGARCKRAFLNHLGRYQSHLQNEAGFPGNDCLVGVTNPAWVHDPEYFTRWIRQVPGQVVELMCHPGFADETLLGRDCQKGDGLLERRVHELRLLEQPSFLQAIAEAGFELSAPSQCWSSVRSQAA